jgi:hypothetical protein
MKALVRLVNNSPTYHKTGRVIQLFNDFSKTAKFADPDSLKEIQDGPLKKWKGLDEAAQKKSMEHVHELIKCDKKNVALAIGALTSNKVYVAENTHRLLVKLNESKAAEEYKKKAQGLYPYSTYFEGAKKDAK